MKKRYYELDLARDMMILILPLVHIIEFLGNEFGYANILNNQTINILQPIVDFLTIYGAPVFMICMGINMMFTSKNKPEDFLKRGISLLLLEFVLNLIRYALPGIISLFLTNHITIKKTITDIIIFAQFNSDILAFSGLCFIAFAIFKKLKLSPIKILGICIVISLTSELFIITYPNLNNSINPFIANILGNFIWLSGDSTFPLVEWLIFPSIGYLFANYLTKAQTTKQETKLWNITGIFSMMLIFTILVSLKVVNISNNDILRIINAPINDSHMSPICTIFEIAATFMHLYIIRMIWNKFKLERNKKVVNHVSTLSKNITYYYCIQWIIVGWIMFITCGLELWNTKTFNIITTILLTLGTMIISSAGSSLIRKKMSIKSR